MIRIFVGCSGNDEDLEFQAVLHYSLEKHASQPIDLTWMRLSRDPSSFWYSDPQQKKGWRTDGWHTPFSALRWGVPAFCNYEGKAIYLDIDMIVMDDIAKLWDQPITNGKMLSKPSAICVTVYDNARMRNILPPVDHIKFRPNYYRTVRMNVLRFNGAIQPYEGNWNCLDMKRDNGGEYKSVDDPDIKILHFTEVPTQPHLRHAVPRLAREGKRHWFTKQPLRKHSRLDAVQFFDRVLEEAISNGYDLDRYRNPTPFGNYGI